MTLIAIDVFESANKLRIVGILKLTQVQYDHLKNGGIYMSQSITQHSSRAPKKLLYKPIISRKGSLVGCYFIKALKGAEE